VPELAGAVVGLGGPGWEYDPETGRQVYVTGLLFLDKPQMANIIESGKRNSAALDVVLHELGHVMGLTHVNGQVMAPYVGSTVPRAADRRQNRPGTPRRRKMRASALGTRDNTSDSGRRENRRPLCCAQLSPTSPIWLC